MAVHITDNTPKIKLQTDYRASLFIRLMAGNMVMASTPNTPKKTGRLRMDVVKQALGLHGKVAWGKNYGIYQETKQYRNYTTAGTGPHFAENAAKLLPNLTQKVAKLAGLI